jgi:hypothetical protein
MGIWMQEIRLRDALYPCIKYIIHPMHMSSCFGEDIDYQILSPIPAHWASNFKGGSERNLSELAVRDDEPSSEGRNEALPLVLDSMGEAMASISPDPEGNGWSTSGK